MSNRLRYQQQNNQVGKTAGKQDYLGYVYQNGPVDNAHNIMRDPAIIWRENDANNTAKFQLLFVLPKGVNYKAETHLSHTTCTITAA